MDFNKEGINKQSNHKTLGRPRKFATLEDARLAQSAKARKYYRDNKEMLNRRKTEQRRQNKLDQMLSNITN